jgi:general stress protein YciG
MKNASARLLESAVKARAHTGTAVAGAAIESPLTTVCRQRPTRRDHIASPLNYKAQRCWFVVCTRARSLNGCEAVAPPRDGEGGAPTPLRRSEGLKEETVTKQLRGFATMDVTKQREIARMGGKAAHAKGTAHEWSREQARLAGHKGGLARARRMEPIIAARKKNQQTP